MRLSHFAQRLGGKLRRWLREETGREATTERTCCPHLGRDGKAQGTVIKALLSTDVKQRYFFKTAAVCSRFAFAQPSFVVCRERPRASASSGTFSVMQDAAAMYAPLPILT